MKKSILAMILAGTMAFSLSACSSSAGSSAAGSAAGGSSAAAADSAAAQSADVSDEPAANPDLPKLTLSIGHNNNTDSLINFVAEDMKEKLEARSGGNITVNIYPNGQLGSESDMFTSCQTGDLTFLISGLHALVSYVPATAISNIPFLFDTVEEARTAWADPELRNLLNEEFKKSGLELILLSDQGFRCMTSNTEITGPDSLNGMSIRTLTNNIQVEAWKMLGANPTPIDFSELYLSLQQGVIDAQENPYDIVDTNKFYEVQKYFTNSNHIYHTISVNVGTATLSSMPQEYQDLIREVCAEVEQDSFKECDANLDTYKANLEANGMIFIDFDQIDGMRQALADRTEGIIDVVRETVNNDELVDAFLAAAGKE